MVDPLVENEHNNATEEEENGRDRWWEAFVTQTDWSGTVMQESWYGHRNPCRRIGLFVLLSSFLSAVAMVVQAFPNWPILYPTLTVQGLNRIKESHVDCFAAICHAVQHIELECEMTDDFSVVLDPLSIPENHSVIPLPDECHEAIRLSFGDDFEHNLLASKDSGVGGGDAADVSEHGNGISPNREIDLLHFHDVFKNENDEEDDSTYYYKTNVPIFQFLPDQCLFEESSLDNLYLGERMDLVDTFFSMKPGDRETIPLRSYACPEYMSQRVQQEIIPEYKKLYDLLLSWRRVGAISIMYLFSMIFHSAMCANRIFFLILPVFFLWLFMPKNEIRGKRVTLMHTLSTLLLITTLLDAGSVGLGGMFRTDAGSCGLDGMLRTGILVVSALSIGNTKAALEWSFLFFLSYMDLEGLSSDIWDQTALPYLYRMDSSLPFLKPVLPWMEASISYLVPGYGLWKVVTVYVIYMAFPPNFSRRSKRSRQHHHHPDDTR